MIIPSFSIISNDPILVTWGKQQGDAFPNDQDYKCFSYVAFFASGLKCGILAPLLEKYNLDLMIFNNLKHIEAEAK